MKSRPSRYKRKADLHVITVHVARYNVHRYNHARYMHVNGVTHTQKFVHGIVFSE